MERRRRAVAVAGVLAVLVLAAVAARALIDGPHDPGPGTAAPTSTAAPTRAPSPSSDPSPSSSPSSTAPPVVAASGSGRLVAVPGRAQAPGRGPITTVRVEVEEGVDVDPVAFAAEVLTTLNDDRSWGHGGARTFARTSGPSDVVVVLASPDTSARLCRPLRTFGKLSCRSGDRAVLTSYRWLRGTEEFPDLAVYRQYVVNHEVGHVLGHGHEQCGGAGRLAPVMQQQTKRVAPCRPNAWPFPQAGARLE